MEVFTAASSIVCSGTSISLVPKNLILGVPAACFLTIKLRVYVFGFGVASTWPLTVPRGSREHWGVSINFPWPLGGGSVPVLHSIFVCKNIFVLDVLFFGVNAVLLWVGLVCLPVISPGGFCVDSYSAFPLQFAVASGGGHDRVQAFLREIAISMGKEYA